MNVWGVFYVLFCTVLCLSVGLGGWAVSLYVERHNKRKKRKEVYYDHQ